MTAIKKAVLQNGQTMRYAEYITSSHWRDRHKEFLKAGRYRCSFAPWLKIGKGKRYACHHKQYSNLGQEIYRRDILVLHPWVHKFIVHGALSGFKPASRQATPYPNKAQRLFHSFCCLPDTIKIPIWLGAIAILVLPAILAFSYLNPSTGLAIALVLAGYSLFQVR